MSDERCENCGAVMMPFLDFTVGTSTKTCPHGCTERQRRHDVEAERDALAARVEELEARIARALVTLDGPTILASGRAVIAARRILRGGDDQSTERTE